MSAAGPECCFGTGGLNELHFMFLINPTLQPVPCYLLIYLSVFSLPGLLAFNDFIPLVQNDCKGMRSLIRFFYYYYYSCKNLI